MQCILYVISTNILLWAHTNQNHAFLKSNPSSRYQTFGFEADEEKKTGNRQPGHCSVTQRVLQWMRLVDAKKS